MISNIKQGFHYGLHRVRDGRKRGYRIQPKHKMVVYGVLLGVLLVGATASGLLMVTYGDKASPATYLSGMDVSGKSRPEIKKLSYDLFDKIQLTMKYDDKTVTANAEDMGLTLLPDESAEVAVSEGANRNIFVRFNPFWKKQVPLQVDFDIKKFQIFLNNEFGEIITPVAEPTLVYDENTMQFEVAPGESGRIISAEVLSETVDILLDEAGVVDIDVEIVDAAPQLSAAAVERTREYVNLRVGLRLDLNYNGRLLYFIDPPDIASWAVFTPDIVNDELKIVWDKELVQQFMEQTVIPGLATSPRNQKNLVDDKGKVLLTIQNGQNGLTPADMPDLISHIVTALEQGVNMAENLNLIEKQFTIENIVISDERWIDVNLGTQHITLYDGANVIAHYIMSSGMAPFYTPTGEFRIVMKVLSQTMQGPAQHGFPAYNLPNVTWVSYFTYQGHAFHTKYWNNIYGTPTSHGCIGLPEAHAKIVYDFAPIGTRVVVHY